MGSSYIDQEGNLIMRKTIQVTAYPSDEEFNNHKQKLINQLSLWASEWAQEYMILEYEDETFFILGMNDMMKQGGELWIQDAVSQMNKKGTIGSFTKQAKREGLTPIEFAKKVLKNPKGYTLKTRRRANFVRNVNPDKF
jgi:predicted transcriptional regulator